MRLASTLSLGLAGLRIQQDRPPPPLLQSSRCAAIGGLAPAAMAQLAVSGMSADTASYTLSPELHMLQLASGLVMLVLQV